MKPKLICIGMIIFMLSIAGIFQKVQFVPERFHQHQQAMTKEACEIHDSTQLCTHLPIISIETDGPIPEPHIISQETGQRVANNEMVGATIKYFDNTSKNNHLSDEPEINERALMRIRGRSSRYFDKKGYYIKFKQDNLIDNKDISLGGMVEDSDWVLHGPHLDKTLIRNYLGYNLAGEIMQYSPNVRFVEIVVNGEYKGVYVLTEKIGYNEKGRVKLTETDPDVTATSYILKLDIGSKDPLRQLETFTEYTGKNDAHGKKSQLLEIIYPSKTLTEEQREYIEDDISKFEKALTSFDSGDSQLGYPSFIDVQSFVDYFIINEFTMNSDAMRLSTYFYKDIRGKLGVIVWDFNSMFDNYIPVMSTPHKFMMTDSYWYKYLLKDQEFVDLVIKRYRELRKTVLSEEYLFNYIDETIDYLGPAIERNYEVWGYTFTEKTGHDRLLPPERNPKNYEEAVQQLKDSIAERGKYLDNNIETLYAISHYSVNKQFRHTGGEE